MGSRGFPRDNSWEANIVNWNKWFGLPKTPALKVIVILVYGVIAVFLAGMIEVALGG